MNAQKYVVSVVLLIACATVWAQQPQMAGPGPGMGRQGPGMQRPGAQQPGDFIGGNFFPPELVMQNQKAIGLTKDQQTAIVTEMQKTVARFTELQWQQSAEGETMASLINKERVDEKEALAQLDKLLAIEDEIKRLNVTMLIKVKNVLTPEQQERLRDLRRQGPQQGPQPPLPPPGPRGPQDQGPGR